MFDKDTIFAEFDYAKQKFPQLKIVVGGQKVAQKRALQKKYPMVDLWVGGMADKSVLGLMKQFPDTNFVKSELDYGSMTEQEFKYSKIHWTDDDYIFPHEALPLEISRGCPFNCAFCDYPKKAVNSWTLDETHLRDVLIENYERFILYCLCGCLIGINIILTMIIMNLYNCPIY